MITSNSISMRCHSISTSIELYIPKIIKCFRTKSKFTIMTSSYESISCFQEPIRVKL
nr:MAG TPA: hypothetical protein [Caudoviricetes sp.]